MSQENIPQFPQFTQMISEMMNPNTRQQWVSKLPANVQRLIQDRDYQLQVLGQEGVQLFADQQDFLLRGTPIPEESLRISQEVEQKLLQMMNAGSAIVA